MYVENVVLATRLGIRAFLVLEQVCDFLEDFTFQAPHYSSSSWNYCS